MDRGCVGLLKKGITMDKQERTKELTKELIKLAHKMANDIRMSHSGWYESYATQDELKLVELSNKLKK